MRAVQCLNWGVPADLKFSNVPVPDPKIGEIRIRVMAAGVNFADTLMISGNYQTKPPLPFSPGMEIAGIIDEIGTDVTDFKIGDRVLAILPYGGFQEFAIARMHDTFIIPDTMGFQTAATFPIAYGTSEIGLSAKLALKPGESVLINGAAGGVGLTAVELAKHIGATVIASAGSDEKLSIAQRYGADYLINYKTENLASRVKQITDGRGVDAVYDPVGGDAFIASLKAVRQGGRILIVGFASGDVPQIPANILLVKNITAMGYFWGAYRVLAPTVMDNSMHKLFNLFESDGLQPNISKSFDLSEVPAALEYLQSRRSTGKIVITTETRH